MFLVPAMRSICCEVSYYRLFLSGLIYLLTYTATLVGFTMMLNVLQKHRLMPCCWLGTQVLTDRSYYSTPEVLTRHTDNSRSPAPDIAVPRQALCYLSRLNRGLKNRRLFLQHPLFLALVNPGNHKPQNAEPSKRRVS